MKIIIGFEHRNDEPELSNLLIIWWMIKSLAIGLPIGWLIVRLGIGQ